MIIVIFPEMIYPENFESKTGIDIVREYIIEKCLSNLGIEKVAAMSFSTNYATIQAWLEQTNEFLQIINNKEIFPTEHFTDIRASLKEIDKDPASWLSEKEILPLANTIETINTIVEFLATTFNEVKIKYPVLKSMSDQIKTFPDIVELANSIIDKTGCIKDNASRLLSEIRRNKTDAVKDISRNMQIAIRSAQSQGLIAKDIQADMRSGYYLIPVNASHKRKIKGIIRDDSGSGKTVYIEPEAVVEASNRLRELESDERKEIARLLIQFTNELRPQLYELLKAYNFLGEIDFIRAKALFAARINGVKPVFENTQQLEWSKAIHPLLNINLRQQNKQAFPLDIRLTKENRILLVSGVNAGGKSLCLKTVALLQYMLQCGLLIPAGADSKAGIFERIFIDIGDGQSMENSLSTYTSHLRNMKFFVEHNTEKTLLLIDEFGGGTEPQIGGAIAEALLEKFNAKKSFGLITTHFQNLKQFAYETDGIINGAMLYDSENMRPMYKLSIGTPGSSFAIEVARKIGLEENIICAAADKMGTAFVNMDNFLQSITRDKLYWEEKRQEIDLIVNIKKEQKEVVEEVKHSAAVLTDMKINIKPGDIVYLRGQSAKGKVVSLKGKNATVSFGLIKSVIAVQNLIILDDNTNKP